MAGQKKSSKEAFIRINEYGLYDVVWYTSEGVRRRKSSGTADAEHAKALMVKIVAEATRPRLGSDPSLEQLIDAYLENRKRAKPTTWRQIEVSLTPVRARLGVLRACLNDSLTRLYIGKVPVFKIEVSESAPRDAYLTQAEVRRMLDQCHVEQKLTVVGDKSKVTYRERDRRHLEGFILIATTTAARKEAILDLRWKQVHLAGPDDVKGPLLDWGMGTVAGKHWIDFGQARGNKRRPRIPISHNPELVRWLWFGAERGGPDDHVITFKGEPVGDLKKGLKTLAEEAGIKKEIAPAHTLKHTAVTWMVQGGVPLSTIADLTNTSERILRKVYGHHVPDYHAELAGVNFG
jgi:integrase